MPRLLVAPFAVGLIFAAGGTSVLRTGLTERKNAFYHEYSAEELEVASYRSKLRASLVAKRQESTETEESRRLREAVRQYVTEPVSDAVSIAYENLSVQHKNLTAHVDTALTTAKDTANEVTSQVTSQLPPLPVALPKDITPATVSNKALEIAGGVFSTVRGKVDELMGESSKKAPPSKDQKKNE